MSHGNWISLLRSHAHSRPHQLAFVWMKNGELDDASLTYLALYQRALGIASFLQMRGWKQRQVLMVYQRGLEFVCGFFGCLQAQVVAVPASMPRNNQRFDRIAAMAIDCNAAAILCSEDLVSALASRLKDVPELASLPIIATDLIDAESREQSDRIDADQTAFLQYTSGSTGSPKGVVVTHANLLHNCGSLKDGFEIDAGSTYVSWLPLFHDMGLIGQALESVYCGVPCYLMAPMSFLQKPVRWLRAISRFDNVISGGPNFAYDYCCERVADADVATLDLSRWRVAFNGSEPVRARTLSAFADRFARAGFRPHAMYPCYGLAESTLFVTGGAVARAPVMRTVDKLRLQDGLALPSDDEDASLTLVSSGRVRGGQQLQIVDPASRRVLPDGQVGEIWLSGPSVALGYLNRPAETEAVFDARTADDGLTPNLRTGDLGFVCEGELFVTGRAKEVLIVRGSNYFPQDIEAVVCASQDGLRSNGTAAFTVAGDDEVERLVIVQEVERTALRSLDATEAEIRIRSAVANEYGLTVSEVVFIAPNGLPRTSSGKIQRLLCRSLYSAGQLKTVKPGAQAPSAVDEAAAAVPDHEGQA